jgi:hypothetical protein
MTTSSATRRAFLAQAAALGLAIPKRMRGQSDPASALWKPNASSFFGVSGGAPIDSSTAYRLGPDAGRLSFDISNNQILCAVTRNGLLHRAVVQTGIVPCETAATPVGAYVDKVLVRSGPWPISLHLAGEDVVRLDELPQPDIFLHQNLFPLFVWQYKGVEIRMLAFAPAAAESAPRVIIAWVGLKNHDAAKVSGTLHEREFSLAAGNSMDISLEFALESSPRETGSAARLLAQTAEFHTGRYGRLRIPDGACYADLFQRAGELARQSILRLPSGEFGGSFNGSEVPDNSTVWMRDCFYACLPQSFLDPELCGAAVLFFLKWGMPSRLLGPGINRFPGAGPVTNSLGNSVAALVLAGTYYQMTGDRSFFLKHTEILTRGEEILNAVLASRRDAPFLFPSLYVSDGDARGDFHTGSNVSAWRAFRSMALLAREVYNAPALAETWESIASAIRDAIRSRCTAAGTYGPQYVEGAMADESFFKLHDGEESDTTLMPFYGFCEPDEAAYLNHARLAVTPENPYYFEKGKGIWWYAHGKWSSATFPGWTTALAGADTQEELLARLQTIRTMTDADGSFWWWPYRHDAPAAPHPSRASVKCAWAAGVFACLFVNRILGIDVDVPAAEVALRPFSPWDEFSWRDCRMGSSMFHFSYRKTAGGAVAEIKNLNSVAYRGVIELPLPAGSQLAACSLNGRPATAYTIGKRYRADSLRLTESVAPGGRFSLEITWRK